MLASADSVSRGQGTDAEDGRKKNNRSANRGDEFALTYSAWPHIENDIREAEAEAKRKAEAEAEAEAKRKPEERKRAEHTRNKRSEPSLIPGFINPFKPNQKPTNIF